MPLTGCGGPPSGDLPQAEYDRGGRLRQLAFDANRNGRNDAVATLDGARIQSIAVDLDEDQKIDRWDFYDEDRQLEKIGFSRAHNGTMDSVEPIDASPTFRVSAQQVRDQFVAAAAQIDARAVIPVQPPGGPSR